MVVKNKINSSSYNPSPKYLKDIIKNYKTDKNEIGIDVSTWQGNIDFNKVKEDGGWGNVSSKTCGSIVKKAIEIANRTAE